MLFNVWANCACVYNEINTFYNMQTDALVVSDIYITLFPPTNEDLRFTEYML